MKNAKETDKKYKYTENAKTAERITELIGDTPSGTVAQDLGLSRQTISNFVNGRYKPVGDNLEKLADYFNVSTDYILGRTDVKSPNTSIIGVCEYLGLTEQAVNSLQEASKFHNKLSDFIENHLIKLISQIMILSENSATFLEYRATHPTIQSDEYEQIIAAEKQTKDKRLSRQVKVLMLRYEGKTNPDIAKKLDISAYRISHLVSAFTTGAVFTNHLVILRQLVLKACM